MAESTYENEKSYRPGLYRYYYQTLLTTTINKYGDFDAKGMSIIRLERRHLSGATN